MIPRVGLLTALLCARGLVTPSFCFRPVGQQSVAVWATPDYAREGAEPEPELDWLPFAGGETV
jgi:hypothetical protein